MCVWVYKSSAMWFLLVLLLPYLSVTVRAIRLVAHQYDVIVFVRLEPVQHFQQMASIGETGQIVHGIDNHKGIGPDDVLLDDLVALQWRNCSSNRSRFKLWDSHQNWPYPVFPQFPFCHCSTGCGICRGSPTRNCIHWWIDVSSTELWWLRREYEYSGIELKQWQTYLICPYEPVQVRLFLASFSCWNWTSWWLALMRTLHCLSCSQHRTHGLLTIETRRVDHSFPLLRSCRCLSNEWFDQEFGCRIGQAHSRQDYRLHLSLSHAYSSLLKRRKVNWIKWNKIIIVERASKQKWRKAQTEVAWKETPFKCADQTCASLSTAPSLRFPPLSSFQFGITIHCPVNQMPMHRLRHLFAPVHGQQRMSTRNSVAGSRAPSKLRSHARNGGCVCVCISRYLKSIDNPSAWKQPFRCSRNVLFVLFV